MICAMNMENLRKKLSVNSVNIKDISGTFNAYFTNQLTDFWAILYYSIINASLHVAIIKYI
jgi:hypothetical protein